MATSDLLSSDEVDELMRAVEQGDLDALTPDRAGEERLALDYDFTSPRPNIAHITPRLDIINERFLGGMQLALFNLTQQNVELTSEPLQMVTLADYIRTLPVPCSINQVNIKPLRGTALIVFEPHLVTCAVDGFFGGGKRTVSARERTEFTPVEQRITRKMLQAVFTQQEHAWSPLMPLEFEYVSGDANPEHTKVPGASEAEQMIVTVVNVKLEGGEGAFHVLFPYTMLEPIRSELTARIQLSPDGNEDRFSQALMDGLADVELPISCALVRTKITIEQLLRLRAGDVLPVQMPTSVVLDVEGMPTYRGVYGTLGESHAVQITAPAWSS